MLQISGLEKSFGDKSVLKGIELSVPEGSVYGFIGQNGAGKTTTMKTVLGLLRPDKGEIRVMGTPVVYGETKTNRYIGYLPDVPAFYPFLTAEEYLRLCGESLSMRRAEIDARTVELLSRVGLSGEKARIKGYSRGMKQRLGIAQALLGRPKLLICDEPTSALDPIGRKEILDILLSAREETTVLFSTHILSDVERICSNVAFLHDGKIAMQGTVGELRRMHRGREFVVELIDSADAEKLLAFFPEGKREGAERILFSGTEDEICRILSVIAAEKLLLRKAERIEPSIEKLFMEVVK
jgi:ABC-2 type transport system ATP-binding protein